MNNETKSRGEITRGQIVNAAYKLFLHQGYHGTSMRQIAADAGVTASAIYNHFSNKEEIFQAVFLENHPYQELLPALMAAEGETVETLVRDMAAKMVDALNRRPNFLNLMFIEIVEFESEHSMQIYRSITPQVSAVIQHMIETDRTSLRTIPAMILIRSFIGLFFSYYLTDEILNPRSDLPAEFGENAMGYFIDIYLHGILR